MIYVALLRGINVGGHSKVDMKQLKAVFEDSGMEQVRTYINSGNVIFSHGSTTTVLTPRLTAAIEKAFGFSIKVLLIDLPSMRTLGTALPDAWQNNSEAKCDVLFLWESYEAGAVIKKLGFNADKESVLTVPAANALIWYVPRDYITRSNLLKIIGTDLYRHMTIRNCNTARKLLTLMEAAEVQ